MRYIKRDFARQLRKEQTPYEKRAWKLLRNRKCFGLKFRRQHAVEGFVADFYCDEQKLAIEIDGEIHNKRRDYDELRQVEIMSKGITFVRITNEELKKDETIVLRKIKEVLSSKTKSTSPSPSGRG